MRAGPLGQCLPEVGGSPAGRRLAALALVTLALSPGVGACQRAPTTPGKASQHETPSQGALSPAPDASSQAVLATEPGPPDDEPAPTDGAPEEAAPTTDRDALTRAYLALYCAQRRGETTRLQGIYQEHGFADPRAWRAVWDQASADREWLAEVTQRAIGVCP